MADQIPDSAKTARIFVRWSANGQFIRKWSREPFADGEPVDAIGRATTDGEALSWRLERIIEDGGPLTVSDKAFLREAAASLSTRAAPPAMDREAVERHSRKLLRDAVAKRDDTGASLAKHDDQCEVDVGAAIDAIFAALATRAADAIRQGEERYLVWSIEHAAWWAPNEMGYTSDINGAGRYDRDAALAIVHRPWGWDRRVTPDEMLILERDAIALATPASHASDGGEA